MAERSVIGDVKAAIREVVDETTVTYVQGAGVFLDRMMSSMSGAADAFDEFFTTNLEKDRPVAAVAFLDLRIRSIRNAQRILQRKIGVLERRRARLSRTRTKTR